MSESPQVIVVGSGPAGTSAAWPLVSAGIRVLMIDASNGRAPPVAESRPLELFRADPARWKDRFGADLACLDADGTLSPKFATPVARSVLAGFAERLRLATRNFVAAGSLGCGGLSKIWGALAEPFEDRDFRDFPVGSTEFRSSYRAVAGRIGLPRGAVRDRAAPASAPARRLLERYQRQPRTDGFALAPAANAVLDTAEDGRAACSHCGLCLFGCSRGSIYDSAQELPRLGRFQNFTYRPDHFVRGLGADGRDHRLEIETGGQPQSLTAPVVVLAAGTIATSGLALPRLGWIDRPVRLLTNPAAAAAFLLPEFLGRDLPDRSCSLGQLFYRVRSAGGEDAAGVLYGADALPVDLVAARLPVARPFALRLAHALAPALLLASCYVRGALSRNTLSVREENGRRRIAIEGEETDEATRALGAALGRLRRTMCRLRAVPLPGSESMLRPGADAHYAGTLPMGGSGPTATSAFGELAGCPRLFVADGACLPALPATHPTFTIMANADRIGQEIARRLTAGVDERTAARQKLAVAQG
jgi:choline dehydrogenase-like flavoprotein